MERSKVHSFWPIEVSAKKEVSLACEFCRHMFDNVYLREVGELLQCVVCKQIYRSVKKMIVCEQNPMLEVALVESPTEFDRYLNSICDEVRVEVNMDIQEEMDVIPPPVGGVSS